MENSTPSSALQQREAATTTGEEKQTQQSSAAPVQLQKEVQPKVIQRDPIVREYQAKPIITEIVERPMIEVRHRTIIKEFHEKPIVEFRQELVGENVVQEQPVFKTVRHEPIDVHSREEEEKVITDLKQKGYRIIIRDQNPKETQIQQLPPVLVTVQQQPEKLTVTRTANEYHTTANSGMEASRVEQRAEIPINNPMEASFVEQVKQVEIKPIAAAESSRVTHQSIHPIQVMSQPLSNAQYEVPAHNIRQISEQVGRGVISEPHQSLLATRTATTSDAVPSTVVTNAPVVAKTTIGGEQTITEKPQKTGVLAKVMKKLGFTKAHKTQ